MESALLFSALMLFLLAGSAVAQPQVTLFPKKTQVLYRGVQNPLIVSVCDEECEDLIFTSPNAEIVKEEGCGIMLKPATSDPETIVYVRRKSFSDSSSAKTFSFRTKSLPPPLAALPGRHEGFISVDVLKIQRGLTAYLDGFDFNVRILVTSFSVTILESSGRWQEFTALRSSDFTPTMKQAFEKLRPGDRLIFSEIVAEMEGRKGIELAPLFATIE